MELAVIGSMPVIASCDTGLPGYRLSGQIHYSDLIAIVRHFLVMYAGLRIRNRVSPYFPLVSFAYWIFSAFLLS